MWTKQNKTMANLQLMRPSTFLTALCATMSLIAYSTNGEANDPGQTSESLSGPLVSPSPSPQPGPLARIAAPTPSPEERVLELVNQERLKNQLPPLKGHDLLDSSAETHSGNMANRNFFAHCDLDAETQPWDRMSAAGYSWNAAAENIAAGYDTPEAVVNGWMNSSGHRANILSTNYRELGNGYVYQADDQNNIKIDAGNCTRSSTSHGPYYHYWTQNFGRNNNVYPAVINREAFLTNTRSVNLYLYGSGWATEMRIRNGDGAWTPWQPFAANVAWDLSAGNGVKEVRVEIRNGAGTVRPANDTILLDGVEPPAKPGGVSASDGNYPDRVQVTWNGVTGASAYEVYRAGAAGGTKTRIATTASTNHADTSVPAGEIHYYWVKACAAGTCSAFSAYDTGYRAQPAAEFAAFAGSAIIDDAWQAVALPVNFQNPVIILAPPTYHGSQPGVVRLDNITGTGFEIAFQEWLYLDGAHAQEAIPYLVLEEGRHEMPDGSVWEVGTFDLHGTGNWLQQRFTAPFPGTPALLLTVQTANDTYPVTVRAREVDPHGFKAALFEEESLKDGHGAEAVGYLAIHSPKGFGKITLGGEKMSYLLQQVTVDHDFVPVLSHTLKLEEEQSLDPETGHVDETVAVLALGQHLFAQVVSFNGADPLALRRLSPEHGTPMEWGVVNDIDHTWTKVPLTRTYTNPVVVAKGVSSNGGNPGVIRLKRVKGNAFKLRYQEWDYLDGNHVPEQVFYLVAEAGTHNLAGLTVQAGKVNTNSLAWAGDWQSITFGAGFSEAPVIFTAVETFNDKSAVTTRVDLPDSVGFELAMDEQEASRDGHGIETLGWIAIEPGEGTTSDGRQIRVFRDEIDHTPSFIPFGGGLNRRHPVVVSDGNSAYGLDPVFLRYRNPTASGIDLYLQEEQSADAEVEHVLEEIGVFVAE